MKFETIIVDDDDMVIFLNKISVVESALSTEPVIASNGSQALDYIYKHQSPELIFLVLLDINMPELDGWGFLDAIQSLTTSIYVVMVTSSVDNRDRMRAKSYKQVIDYVEKPLSIDACARIKKLPEIAALDGNR